MDALIEKKFDEFQEVVESFPNCKLLFKKNRYHITSLSGVKWYENSDKWGEVFLLPTCLKIAIDFDFDTFTENELKSYFDLPFLQVGVNKRISHVKPIWRNRMKDKFNTLNIVLYESGLRQYDFTTEKFKEFLRKTIIKNGII